MVGVRRVAQTDPPGRLRAWPSPHDDVATCVDAEVLEPGGREEVGNPLHGPALDVSAGVEPGSVRRGHFERIKGTSGLAPQPLAGEQDVGNLRVDVLEGDLTEAESGDGAIETVGTERGVDVVEPERPLRRGPACR